MPNETGLDDVMAAAARRVGTAEILVGIRSYKNAATIGVVRSAFRAIFEVEDMPSATRR